MIPLYIAGVAIGSGWLLASLAHTTQLPFWVEVPGTATLYGLLYGLFRSWGWKMRLFEKLGVVRVPNLQGEWHGYVTSSFDKLAVKLPVTVQVRQNWTHMSIILRSQHSESHSVVASVFVGDETLIHYQYENVPKAGAKGTMHAHRGTASVKLSEDGSTLAGDYYSGRDRTNHGALLVSKRAR
ncbi:MAG: hypothetical protein ABSA70_12700 [Terriglobia bacterium]